MRLRRKITVAFFLVSSLVSVVLAVFLYRFVERQLAVELRDKLRDIAQLGAHSIDAAAYRRLVDQLGELDDSAVSDIEHSPGFQAIYDQLRQIRSAEPALIHYVYLLTPTGDPKHPKFVVDADVLELDARRARGETVTEDISHYNKPYDVKDIPLLEQALTDCTSQLEPDFVRDPTFGVSSVSAYAPLGSETGAPLRDAGGRCLGVLGVDITDQKMRAALESAGSLALRISIAVVALALLVSIKTIGDAYMVVAGIPSPVADHATAITRMALDMIDSIEGYGRRNDLHLAIRVGIHTGSVVAGVIGTKKFIYDLWGDTVNTASRMESHGVPGRVHVSEATYLLLADRFDLERRAPIDVKGKGTMQTYLVIGQRRLS